MGQHAREANGKDDEIAAAGLKVLREGLPMMRNLGRRSSEAKQGLMFYEELINRQASGLGEVARKQMSEDSPFDVNASRSRQPIAHNQSMGLIDDFAFANGNGSLWISKLGRKY
jgi:hypothetical protein